MLESQHGIVPCLRAAFIADGDVLVDKTLGLTGLLKGKGRLKHEIIERKAMWAISGKEAKSKTISYKTQILTQITKPQSIDIIESYFNELSKIKPGKKEASRYHQLIFEILKILFDNRLRKGKKEAPHANNTQRVDISFKNTRDHGFFKELDEGYHLVCPNIFIECKNYTEDLENPEFAQIQTRLSKTKGQFGIIICRTINSPKKIKDKQVEAIIIGEFVIVLDDNDIKNLIKFKMKGNEDGIDEYLEEKYKKLT